MLVYLFRAGQRTGVWGDDTSAADVIQDCKRVADNPRGHNGGFLAGAREFIETELIPEPWHRRHLKVTHSLAHREKTEPDTVFVGVISTDEFYRQRDVATAAFRAQQAEIARAAKAMSAALEGTLVRWEELPARLQARLHGKNLAPDKCWLWKPDERLSLRRKKTADTRPLWLPPLVRAAPYREFFILIRGPVPKGVILRHTCDNQRCMNPNHLVPGTPGDNVQDMMKRRRHYRQVRADKAAKKRASYLRRKARQKPAL